MSQLLQKVRAGSLTPTLAFAFCALLANLAFSDVSAAEPGSLEGSWSGTGSVSFTTGVKETVHCRVRYTRTSNISYFVSATCATSSGKTTQSANLQGVATNRYRGSFRNSDYNVSGMIYVAVHGDRQTVTLTSDVGSASLRLRR